jgi:hypothetical protein
MNLMPIPHAAPRLNELFYVNPKREASANTTKERLLKTAAIVICVAALAIGITALVFSFLSTAGFVMPIVLTVSSISVIPLSWAAAKVWNLSAPYQNLASIEGTIEQIKNKILIEYERHPSDQRQEHTLQLLRRFGITHSESTLRELSNSLPNKDAAPTALFLPLLARLEYWIAKTVTHHLATHKLWNDIKSIDSHAKRAELYEQAFQNQQANTLRAALNAAIMLEIIEHPIATKQSRLSDLGTTQIKPALTCLLDPELIKDNTYFTLHQENAKPIYFDEVQKITNQLVENFVSYENSTEKDPSVPPPFLDQLRQLQQMLFCPLFLEKIKI